MQTRLTSACRSVQTRANLTELSETCLISPLRLRNECQWQYARPIRDRRPYKRRSHAWSPLNDRFLSDNSVQTKAVAARPVQLRQRRVIDRLPVTTAETDWAIPAYQLSRALPGRLMSAVQPTATMRLHVFPSWPCKLGPLARRGCCFIDHVVRFTLAPNTHYSDTMKG